MAVFRAYLRENAVTPDDEGLLAAKFMGRWRGGARLVLAPDKDEAELGADPMRNNDFNYKEMDPFGYACPLGSHARRLNPRDTAHYMNRRRMIRRVRRMGRLHAAGALPQWHATGRGGADHRSGRRGVGLRAPAAITASRRQDLKHLAVAS